MRHTGLSIWVVCMVAVTTIARKAHISVTKPGKCPTFVTPDPPTPCARPTDFCRHDGDCPGNEKCCRRTFCDGYVCGSPEPVSKPGQCPKLVIPDPRPLCMLPIPKCNDDYDCPKDEKCCRRSVCEGFECGPPAQDNVCDVGTPQVTSSGEQVFCGRGPNREDCKAGYKCKIDPIDGYAVCCRKATHKRRPKLCYLRSEVGQCKASILRWFYNKRTRKCEKFYYGGCGGNENNFPTAEECVKTCRPKCPRLECLKYTMCSYGIATDENGCKTCGCIEPCEGVECEPYQQCAVQAVQCFMAPCPPIGQCVDDPKGPCHVELLALPDPIPMGAFVPQCEDDGYYQPAQFHASTGQSWCVTREGEEIDGTRSLPGQPITDCNRDK